MSYSATPFSFCLQSFPASGTFAMSQLFSSSGQSAGASAAVLPMNIQDWFPLALTGLISLQSKGLSRVLYSTISSSAISLLYDPNLAFVYDCWKNHSIDYGRPLAKPNQTKPLAKWCLCFLIHCLGLSPFLPRSKHFISRLQSPSTVILEPKKIKSVTVYIFFPIHLLWSDGSRCHDLSFWNVEF